MSREGTTEEHRKAVGLRERGRSYGQIAYMLSRDWTTIYRWMNPEAQKRNRERARRWRQRKPATARSSRRAAHHRAAARGVYGRCKHCSGPLRAKGGKTGVCARCRKADTEFFWREILELWNQGRSVVEIADELHRGTPAITSAIRCMRQNGWNVPYRRLDSRKLALPCDEPAALPTEGAE